MSKPSNPFVFPSEEPIENPYQGDRMVRRKGITLRDYFAAKALDPLIHAYTREMPNEIESTVKLAYEIADSMLKERERSRPTITHNP